MTGFTIDRRGLSILCAACAALLGPVLLAFAVNVELGLRVFWPGCGLVEGLLPGALFRQLARFSVDLSAVSTLVPLLMLAFPLVQGLRILRRKPLDAAFIRNLKADPYPAHFAFFLVMLGLVGTLHGMWIGLRTSGIDAVAAQSGSPEAIQETLDRLLGGTATAIISSLVGIVAAFFAARPVPWLFRRLIRIAEEEQRQTLSQTLETLNHDLAALGNSARGWNEEMEKIHPARLPQQLDAIVEHLARLTQCVRDQDARWERLLAGQDDIGARARQLDQLAANAALQTAALRESVQALAALREGQERAEARWTALVQPLVEQQRQVADKLTELAALLARTAEDQRTDRASLKRALSELVK